jgi:hypothetical protein
MGCPYLNERFCHKSANVFELLNHHLLHVVGECSLSMPSILTQYLPYLSVIFPSVKCFFLGF